MRASKRPATATCPVVLGETNRAYGWNTFHGRGASPGAGPRGRGLPLLVKMIPALLLPFASGCSYVEQARRFSDAGVGVSHHYKVEALVQADIERKRIRKARCYSPLLTPATISAASSDARLGAPWIDELLRDCPEFGAFISDLTFRRARDTGLLPPLERTPLESTRIDAPVPAPSSSGDSLQAEPGEARTSERNQE